jgi:hypothetical protein
MTFISITIIINIVLIRSALKSQTQADGHTRTSLLKGLHDVTLWLKYHTGRYAALGNRAKPDLSAHPATCSGEDMLTLTHEDLEHWRKLARSFKEHDPSRAVLGEGSIYTLGSSG